jgi:hypothetical protein
MACNADHTRHLLPPLASCKRDSPSMVLADPFVSTETLEMTHRATSVSSKRNINTDSDDE